MTGLASVVNNTKFTSLGTVNQLTGAVASVLSQPAQVSLKAGAAALALLGNVVSTVSASSSLVATATDAYSNRELVSSASNMLSCMGLVMASTNLQGVTGATSETQLGSASAPLRSISPEIKSYLKGQAEQITSYQETIKKGLLSKKVPGTSFSFKHIYVFQIIVITTIILPLI